MGKIKAWAARKQAEYDADMKKPSVQVFRAGGMRTQGAVPWDDPSRGVDVIGAEPPGWKRHMNCEQFKETA